METCTAGSASGLGKRTSSNAGTAPQADSSHSDPGHVLHDTASVHGHGSSALRHPRIGDPGSTISFRRQPSAACGVLASFPIPRALNVVCEGSMTAARVSCLPSPIPLPGHSLRNGGVAAVWRPAGTPLVPCLARSHKALVEARVEALAVECRVQVGGRPAQWVRRLALQFGQCFLSCDPLDAHAAY
jgi:hypothetical protein